MTQNDPIYMISGIRDSLRFEIWNQIPKVRDLRRSKISSLQRSEDPKRPKIRSLRRSRIYNPNFVFRGVEFKVYDPEPGVISFVTHNPNYAIE